MGPYREPAEDVEASIDAREVEAFKASLERRGRRARVGVVLVVFATVAFVASIASLSLRAASFTPPPPRTSSCETRFLEPPSGDPFPMTICH